MPKETAEEKKSFIVYGGDLEEDARYLSESDQGKFFMAILAYENRREELIREKGVLQFAFMKYKKVSDRNREKWEHKKAVAKANGSAGGKARAANYNQGGNDE